jgi:hypothetical protein
MCSHSSELSEQPVCFVDSSASDFAGSAECAHLPWEPPAHREGQQASHSRPSDSATQPHHSWVGQLSSPCGQQGNLPQSGHSDFSYVVVLGDTEASEETRSMDRAEILSDATRTPVDLRRDVRGPPRATAGTHALSCRRRADPTACEDQRDGKPLRPAMGSIL